MASGNWSLLVTVATGQLITAAERNNEFNNVLSNANQDGIAGASEDLAHMQSTTNPAPGGVPSLATSGRGELTALRFMLASLTGKTQWYTAPDITLAALNTFILAIAKYRRPVLQYASGTVVNTETGLDGVSGDCTILFPDGTLLTDSTVGDINCNLAQVAAFTSGTIQSGLFSGTVTNNTWYSFYAVKVTKVGSTTRFVVVALAIEHKQANFATLNSNFGTNGWVYLGCLPYGDRKAVANAIPKFVMSGNKVVFSNTMTNTVATDRGINLTDGAPVTTLTWTYATGTSLASAQVPGNILIGDITESAGNTTNVILQDAAATRYLFNCAFPSASQEHCLIPNVYLGDGLKASIANNVELAINLTGYIDSALGVGANPLL